MELPTLTLNSKFVAWSLLLSKNNYCYTNQVSFHGTISCVVTDPNAITTTMPREQSTKDNTELDSKGKDLTM